MHTCNAVGAVAQCSCYAGYRLGADNQTCAGRFVNTCIISSFSQVCFTELVHMALMFTKAYQIDTIVRLDLRKLCFDTTANSH